MARQIGFHFYSFKIWQKHTSEREILSAIRGGVDCLDLFFSGLQEQAGSRRNEEAAKRLIAVRDVQLAGRHLCGIIEAGSYGETADIVHSATRALAHRQSREEATLLPCFFRLYVPAGEERGILVLQRDNRVPAKPALTTFLQILTTQLDPHLTCGFTPIANAATFSRLIDQGDVQELRFIRLSIPQDVVDSYDSGRHEDKGKVELVFSANRGLALPMKNALGKILRGSASESDLYEIPGFDEFEYDTVKAKLRIGKKLQTVDFGRRQTAPIVDVTDQVTFDALSGHPTYDSLLRVTAELIEDSSLTAYGD